MLTRFLLTMVGCFILAGCSAAGTPGQPIVIVVTATPPPGAPGAVTGAQPTEPAATEPAAGLPAAPATLPPVQAGAPTQTAPANAAPANTAPAVPSPTTGAAAVVPATGTEVQVSFDQLLDYNVVDANGNFLGEVQDAVVERGTGNAGLGTIPYLVVDSTMRDDWNIPVPWKNVQVRPELQAVMLPVNATQLAAAPGFNDEIWPANFGGLNNAVQTFWANPGQAAGIAPALPGGFAANYLRASDVMDVDVLNAQGLKLGDIQDIAIDWQNSRPGTAEAAQFRYLLMEMNDDFGFDNRMIPVPWQLVGLNPGQENVVVNVAQNLVLTAPNFLKGSLPNLYGEPWTSQLSQFWP